MDEALLVRAQEDLVEWGVLERAPSLQPTRRFRGALMRAAGALREEELAGGRRPGHAVENTVALALEGYPLPAGAAFRREHRMLLVAIQLASLPEAARALLER